MKKFLLRLLVSLALVLAWRSTLGILLHLTASSPLDIQFPYYDTDLAPFYPRPLAIWAHFDGVHYLRLAAHGYQDTGTQAFFPLYPLLIHAFTPLFSSPLLAATAISLLALAFALSALPALFPASFRWRAAWLFLFPVSFFFAAVYTESLFLALSLWFFVCLKKHRYFSAAVLAGLASATRFTGIFLVFPFILALPRRLPVPKKIFLLFFSLAGFFSYSYFLWLKFHDPLLFFHVQPLFGAERSGSQLIFLPQVIWRYLKIFFTVPPYFWLFQRAFLEFGLFIAALFLLVVNWNSLSPGLNLYLVFSLLTPTLTGTLSSFPRYLLVLLPWLIPRSFPRWLYPLLSLPLLYLFLTYFGRGWFIA